MEKIYPSFRERNIFSKRDARVVILTLFSLNLLVLSCKGFVLPMTLFVACSVLYGFLKISIKRVFIRFAEPLMIAGTLVLLKFIFAGEEGLRQGLLVSSRIFAAASLIIFLSFTVSFIDFIATLAWLRVPKLFIEILLLSYRSLFILFEEAAVIYQAQTNRLGYSSLRRGVSSFSSLAGLLVIKVFEHNSRLTTALIQRGYDGEFSIPEKKWNFHFSDILFAGFILGAAGWLWKV